MLLVVSLWDGVVFSVTRTRHTAWVVFSGSEARSFWRLFNRRGWRHVRLLLPAYYPEPGLTADVYTLFVDPRSNYVDVRVIWLPPEECARQLMEHGATAIIKFPVDHFRYRDYVPRGFLTCVSLPKAILGIRSWMIITPWQLARYLLRTGGKLWSDPNVKPVFPGHPEAQRGQGGAEGAAPPVSGD